MSHDGERMRYLLVGGWNTLFGLTTFWALHHLFFERAPLLVILVATNILSVTQAFLAYKLLVFRTRGRWLEEYLRCYVVYAGTSVLTFVAVPLLVNYLGVNPVLANTAIMMVAIAVSFIGHKRFSFARDCEGGAEEGKK